MQAEKTNWMAAGAASDEKQGAWRNVPRGHGRCACVSRCSGFHYTYDSCIELLDRGAQWFCLMKRMVRLASFSVHVYMISPLQCLLFLTDSVTPPFSRLLTRLDQCAVVLMASQSALLPLGYTLPQSPTFHSVPHMPVPLWKSLWKRSGATSCHAHNMHMPSVPQ